jgi:hypothetical protein
LAGMAHEAMNLARKTKEALCGIPGISTP